MNNCQPYFTFLSLLQACYGDTLPHYFPWLWCLQGWFLQANESLKGNCSSVDFVTLQNIKTDQAVFVVCWVIRVGAILSSTHSSICPAVLLLHGKWIKWVKQEIQHLERQWIKQFRRLWKTLREILRRQWNHLYTVCDITPHIKAQINLHLY